MQYRVLHRGFVCERVPTEMCHASTVLPLEDGDVLVAWFGGSHEGNDDVGIWLARRPGGNWTPPQLLTTAGEPHWNPVLLQFDESRIALYYKVGREIKAWRTLVRWSDDLGQSWSAPQEMVPGDRGGRGPVRCKIIRLASGRLLAPASLEHGVWEAFADRSDDGGHTWHKSNRILVEGLAYNEGERTAADSGIAVSEQSFHGRGVIQPTLWQSGPGRVHMLLRSTQGCIYRSDSEDDGETWCPAYETALPNNNSGIELDRLADGTLALTYNPVGENWGPRSPMTLAISADDGASWERLLDLDGGEGEFSYPAVVARGRVLHITYTWDRKTIAYWQIELK